jgi:hypothetical protein
VPENKNFSPIIPIIDRYGKDLKEVLKGSWEQPKKTQKKQKSTHKECRSVGSYSNLLRNN